MLQTKVEMGSNRHLMPWSACSDETVKQLSKIVIGELQVL